MSDLSEISDEIYKIINDRIAKKELDTINKMKLLVQTMELAERMDGLTGPQKKEVVLMTINKFYTKNDDSELGDIIDTVISVSRGIYYLNKQRNTLKKILSTCCVKLK
jgi:superfamily I DNA and RNA helicase